MRTIQVAAAGAGLSIAAAIPYLFSQQQGAAGGPRASMMEAAAVRIEFGIADREARAWNGSISARAGEILSLRNWRPRPGDSINGHSFTLATRRGVNFALRPWEMESLTEPPKYLTTPGVIVDVLGSAATEVEVQTTQGAFTVRPFELAAGAPVRLLNGGVIAERVPAAEMLTAENANSDFPSLVGLPQGRLVAAWVGFRNGKNELLSRGFTGQQWSQVYPITTRHADIFLVKLGRDKNDRPWAVWSAQVEGNWDLYASHWAGQAWSEPQRLTNDPQPDIYHAVTTDSSGNLWVVWQGFRSGKSDIFTMRYDGQQWSQAEKVSASPANDWAPAIASDGAGRVFVAWDSYDKGNYDVLLRRWESGRWSEISPIANSLKWEAHVSLACDQQNRLWAAWNEAGMDWGKDTGFLPRKQGTTLYRDRWIGVAVHDGQGWKEPVQPLDRALPARLRGHNDLPVLAAGADGRVWLFFRHRFLRIRDTPSDTPAHRAAWEEYATTFEGERWRAPMPAPFSAGRQHMTFAAAVSGGSLYAAWPMDNRDYEEFLFTRADVYAARLPLPAVSGDVKLQPRVQPDLKLFSTHYDEAKDLERIHSYAIDSGGKRYKIYRGDTHRHTEFSMDGNNDGALLDTYRYAIDAAEMDYLMVSEHNGLGGPDNEYPNWLLQQMVDVMSVSGRFVPFYGYERSVNYPNGHRNIIFTRRGSPTLPIPPEEQKGQTGAKMLYEYLKKHKGIAISHTSASNMGTDWRDNDPDVEPLVEIYQGDRVSAEYEGAPKAAWAGNPASAPGGFRPLGYVWNAWAKGYKLGVQVSSDHLSTHISYACTLATDYTRDGLLDAMRQRHSYGATDNIILDYRMKAGGKEYLQGDIASVPGDFTLHVKAIGTQPVRQIDIIRGDKFMMTSNPMKREAELTFRDAQPLKGESYYYVRLIQADEQMAWSSPIWIKR
ncbi:MAG: hypothetical protein HY235_11095 [Acidobacteria bacterium]|nr:hypothetical protein [Acidobacteriota bacterium]